MQGVQSDRRADGVGGVQLHHPGPPLPGHLLQEAPHAARSPARGETALLKKEEIRQIVFDENDAAKPVFSTLLPPGVQCFHLYAKNDVL